MSVDELVEAATEKPKPKPKPRTRSLLKTLDKPVEEMSVDDLIAAANDRRHDAEKTAKPTQPVCEKTTEDKAADDDSDWDQQSSVEDQVC